MNIDTTVQEKNITYPTDAKLAIKIINRLNKLAKFHGILQQQTFVKEIKNLRLSIRHFRHVNIKSKSAKSPETTPNHCAYLHPGIETKAATDLPV